VKGPTFLALHSCFDLGTAALTLAQEWLLMTYMESF